MLNDAKVKLEISLLYGSITVSTFVFGWSTFVFGWNIFVVCCFMHFLAVLFHWSSFQTLVAAWFLTVYWTLVTFSPNVIFDLSFRCKLLHLSMLNCERTKNLTIRPAYQSAFHHSHLSHTISFVCLLNVILLLNSKCKM